MENSQMPPSRPSFKEALAMDSLGNSSLESAKVTEGGELILQTMSDLYSLELSAALLQAADAKMIAPVETTPTMLKFYVSVCRIHQMMMLPACPMCIE